MFVWLPWLGELLGLASARFLQLGCPASRRWRALAISPSIVLLHYSGSFSGLCWWWSLLCCFVFLLGAAYRAAFLICADPFPSDPFSSDPFSGPVAHCAYNSEPLLSHAIAGAIAGAIADAIAAAARNSRRSTHTRNRIAIVAIDGFFIVKNMQFLAFSTTQ